jgi:hypothetical protein
MIQPARHATCTPDVIGIARGVCALCQCVLLHFTFSSSYVEVYLLL